MNAALIRKTARESLGVLLVVTFALIAFETFFVIAVRQFADQISELWQRIEFFRFIIQTVFGADRLADLNSTTLTTAGLAHPLLYALTWALILTLCTRVATSEIERGTAELLLTLPMSRAAVYISVSAVCALAGVIISAAPLLGMWLGQTLAPPKEPIELWRLVPAAANLLALCVAIGGVTLFVGSASTQRGKAIAVVLAGLLGSLLLSFLANIWVPARKVAFLGVLHYYQPLSGVRNHHWPLGDMAVLLVVGLCGWLAGLWWYSRRDVPAA